MAKVAIDINKTMAKVTMKVELRGLTKFNIKKWIAIKLIQMATRILGCGIEITENGLREIKPKKTNVVDSAGRPVDYYKEFLK